MSLRPQDEDENISSRMEMAVAGPGGSIEYLAKYAVHPSFRTVCL